MKILISLTSTHKNHDFAERIKQLENLGIDEIALFPTMLNREQRRELFKLLKKSKIKSIPFVHLRSDMDKDEIDFLINNFKTSLFNIHGKESGHVFNENNNPELNAYNKHIYLESQYMKMTDQELKKYAGICLDVSHFEDMRINRSKMYDYWNGLFKQYKCGCGHISAIGRFPQISSHRFTFSYSFHRYKRLRDFDYLKKHASILPKVMALELENTIEEQVAAKKYIELMLKNCD